MYSICTGLLKRLKLENETLLDVVKFGSISVIGLNMEINSADNCSLASLFEQVVMSGCVCVVVVILYIRSFTLGNVLYWKYVISDQSVPVHQVDIILMICQYK